MKMASGSGRLARFATASASAARPWSGWLTSHAAAARWSRALAGVLLVAASFFLRGGSRVAAGLVGAILALTKLWWMPFALWQQFDDGQVFGYTLKYFPQYWPAASIIVGAIALIGLVSAIFRRP